MNHRIIAVGAAVLSVGCSTLYTSSFDRDDRPDPQDAFVYGSFWLSGVSTDMTMGMVLECRDGKRYVLPFRKLDPTQVFKISPSTCTATGTVLTYNHSAAAGEERREAPAGVRPVPGWRTRTLVFEPGKAYYLGDFKGIPGMRWEPYVYHVYKEYPYVRITKTYAPYRTPWGWELEKNEDKYQATTREFREAYPKLAGVPTEPQMIPFP